MNCGTGVALKILLMTSASCNCIQFLFSTINIASVKPKPKPKPEPSVPKKEIEKVIKDEDKREKKPKRPVPANFKVLKGDSFICRVFWQENVQNTKSFRRATQN